MELLYTSSLFTWERIWVVEIWLGTLLKMLTLNVRCFSVVRFFSLGCWLSSENWRREPKLSWLWCWSLLMLVYFRISMCVSIFHRWLGGDLENTGHYLGLWSSFFLVYLKCWVWLCGVLSSYAFLVLYFDHLIIIADEILKRLLMLVYLWISISNIQLGSDLENTDLYAIRLMQLFLLWS